MVDYVKVTPMGLRGGGFLLEPRGLNDYATYDCDLVVHTESIDDELVNVYRISTGTSEGYSVSEIMSLITANLIKNLTYTNNQIQYTSVSASEIQDMNDLNGVIVGLDYTEDGMITYDTFESNNALLYDADLTILAGAITNLRYNTDRDILYDTIGEINE